MATAGVLVAALCLLALLAIRLGRFARRMESAEARSRADRASEARLRALLGASGDAIVVIDTDLQILAFGEQLAPLFGLTAGAELSTLAAILPADERARMRDCVSALSGRPGHSDRLTWLVPGPEGVRHVEVFVVDHSSDSRIGGIVLSARDITDRVELEAALEHQASHDPLTGLPNRSYLAERLAQRLAHEQGDSAAAREQAIVLLDLDDFRAINDSVGHRVGDALLIELAERLEAATVPGDLLARVGGDGFAFLVDPPVGETEAVARQRADLMLSALEQPMRDGSGAEHLLRGSVGIAVAETSELGSVQDHASLTFRDAELAMYEAKAVEGNSVEFYAPHMHGAVAQRLQLRSEMMLGLERGEFLLHYQPIVDLRRRSIVGYEALVRWQHPERGMVSPAEFIPAAEQSGLIVELGDWVLREACRQLVAWQPQWSDPRYVAVNVAGQQLERPDHIDRVRAALAFSGLAPEQLVLEVTESSLIHDSEASIERLQALRDLGVRLAIDDFGTGYSSLSYLHRFSVDLLKIDKSFIDHVAEAGPSLALVDAITTMADRLGLRVVAEGIEDTDQVQVLQGLPCGFAQGFHFSRPLPAEQVPGIVLPGEIRRAA